MATVPNPTLDARNGDLVTAQAITSLPDELSDRSDGSPQVVLLEANGALYDALMAQPYFKAEESLYTRRLARVAEHHTNILGRTEPRRAA